jgi:hypothetical protein
MVAKNRRPRKGRPKPRESLREGSGRLAFKAFGAAVSAWWSVMGKEQGMNE